MRTQGKQEEDSELELALTMVNELALSKKGRYLNEIETIVFRGAWYGQSYEKMAQNSTYAQSYLHNTVAPDLWKLLGEIFGTEGRIGKRELRSYVSRIVKKVGLSSIPILGEPPDICSFYGREGELANLKAQIVQKRLIYVYGEAGIGKSTLIAKLFAQISQGLSQGFDFLVWKSVCYGPDVEELVASLYKMLNLEGDEKANVSGLINQLRWRRFLIVLDGFEAINTKQRRDYMKFLLHFIEEVVDGCLILMSREFFLELSVLLNSRCISTIKLEGLDIQSAMQIFESKGLSDYKGGSKAIELIEYYRGNPTELTALAEKISCFFGGSIEKFYEYKTTFISDHSQSAFQQLFALEGGLSDFGREIVIYLASEISKESKPVDFSNLLGIFSRKTDLSTLVRELENLEGQSLIEKKNISGEACYMLPPVVKKYVLSQALVQGTGLRK
ncbi:MAG: NACHT domain-containing protein [Pelatocladus maniniholoensis HA4357-MV3]|uniref:NACHT domain-containing protein n=1 Tax=Pelatocladus maniniholoensis HA4357-MV3 TaxID=1117104 RepID=A0A9E3HDW8_9NOST|nr:NACHT domain-containing protein [Pelatocladus maniniholoensis HA4357-MV3]BAZ71045.1 hypothetical protein NIES4106_58420 [Fischerella sp. NIES-4106]